MKQFITSFVILILVGTITSCKKDDVDNSNSEFANATYGNGETFTATQDSNEVQFISANITNVSNLPYLRIIARQDRPNNNYITFDAVIQNYTGPGVYISGANATNNADLSIIFGNVRYYSSNSISNLAGFTPGEILITSDDGISIEGTFRFDGYNFQNIVIPVTNGQFKANF
tara:strand:+ start:101183 stop:101701 length:519 start_codon:yes stop_codon:yes gene_type:complete